MDSELSSSKKQIGEQRVTEMLSMSSFLSSVVSSLNNTVLPLVAQASDHVHLQLSTDTKAQHVSMHSLKQDLESQMNSMRRHVAATHRQVDETHAKEVRGIQTLRSQDAVANTATSQLVAALQESIKTTQARLDLAREQLLQEQHDTKAKAEADVTHTSQQVSEKYSRAVRNVEQSATSQVS